MSIPCPFASCPCPHAMGCVAGWVDFTDSNGRPKTRPCPMCRPEVAAHMARAWGTGAQVRRGLRRLQRPSRART